MGVAWVLTPVVSSQNFQQMLMLSGPQSDGEWRLWRGNVGRHHVLLSSHFEEVSATEVIIREHSLKIVFS